MSYTVAGLFSIFHVSFLNLSVVTRGDFLAIPSLQDCEGTNRSFLKILNNCQNYKVYLPVSYQEHMKRRSVQHQIDAIEQRLSNEILSGFKWFLSYMEGAVTTTKWRVYNDCTMIVPCNEQQV